FLRNATMAKIAGRDSSLLQIPPDERTRVSRVAELFSEEDLARHLQIMLRTHAELGYRQEQRFHLELGMLKMVHAQRLLPIEQLLTEAAGSTSAPGSSGPSPRQNSAPTSDASVPARSSVSPFAADSVRKRTTELPADTGSGPRLVSQAAFSGVVLGAAASGATTPPSQPAQEKSRSFPPVSTSDISELRDVVLKNLADAGNRMLLALLAAGEWSLEGSELLIKVGATPAVIEMSLGAEARRVIIASLSDELGRPAKLRVLGGGTAQAERPLPAANGSRARAEQDPVVRRMKEKFRGEIRTVIDYKDKK
ncbi:MAG: hypothetical protein JO249_15450, partial [Acidobacteria bacterium]|nr:hypothetical protein [Acidobacteriota bacterium]